MPTLVLYPFRFRDPLIGKWVRATGRRAPSLASALRLRVLLAGAGRRRWSADVLAVEGVHRAGAVARML